MKSNNNAVVPEAREALDKFKMEAASDLDVPTSYWTLKNHIYLQTRPISLPSPACGASLLAAPPTAFQAKKPPPLRRAVLPAHSEASKWSKV